MTTNTLITPTMIAREGLFHLENNLVLAGIAYKEYAKEFKGSPKIGNTVKIRKPVKFVAQDGATLVKQDVTERSVDLVISQRKHVGWEFDSTELTLEIEEYSKRYIKPAAIALADKVDRAVAELYSELYLSSGTPGTTPTGFDDFADAGEIMDDTSVPSMDRHMIFNSKGKWGVLKGEKALFNSDQQAQRSIVRRGIIGDMAGFSTYHDQNIVRHQVGADVTNASILVNEASPADGDSTLVVDGLTVSTTNALRVGDVFTIAGVQAVNQINGEALERLAQFTVTAALDSDAGGDGTIAFTPAFQSTGPYKNISALPADDAAVTVMGLANSGFYPQNLAVHGNCMALATVPLVMPDSVNFKARISHKGIGIRVIKAYDEVNDEEIIRMDVMWGQKVIYPELGVRHWG